MGIALSSSISAERTTAGGIVAAQPESRQAILRRFQTALAVSLRMKCSVAGGQLRSGIAPTKINLCVFLSTTNLIDDAAASRSSPGTNRRSRAHAGGMIRKHRQHRRRAGAARDE
ncbi:hypothetical protein [uncultured Bradyrhizobium sp.]|uniref:hypothetical protein n=1 Tax=Bradyrhizobium sp. TaxID=376 RepID=UPI0026282C25|nr:hypothetical protein [uncultured Bradyrhizobium sp.]